MTDAPAESIIRVRLQHKLDELEAKVRYAEQDLTDAEQAQAACIREQASRQARYVDSNALLEAETVVNVKRCLVEGCKQNLERERKRQQTRYVQAAIDRFERAAADVTEWDETWSQCIALIQRAARSYGRAMKVVKRARRDFERPYEAMRAALAEAGLDGGPRTPGGDVTVAFQAVWSEAIREFHEAEKPMDNLTYARWLFGHGDYPGPPPQDV